MQDKDFVLFIIYFLVFDNIEVTFYFFYSKKAEMESIVTSEWEGNWFSRRIGRGIFQSGLCILSGFPLGALVFSHSPNARTIGWLVTLNRPHTVWLRVKLEIRQLLKWMNEHIPSTQVHFTVRGNTNKMVRNKTTTKESIKRYTEIGS